MGKSPLTFPFIIYKQGANTMIAKEKSNIKEETLQGHRFCKKLTNSDYGTVAFLLSRNDILRNKKANANSFSDIELTYNCIYFLIGYEQNTSCF